MPTGGFPEQDSSGAAGLGTLTSDLIRDGKEWATAQVDIHRNELIAVVADAKRALIMVTIATALALSALVALLVGAIIALLPVVGPIVAIVIVVGVALAIAALLTRAAVRSFSGIKARSAIRGSKE